MTAINCRECGVEIQPATARKHDGKCVPCSRGTRIKCSNCGGPTLSAARGVDLGGLCAKCRVEKERLRPTEIDAFARRHARDGCPLLVRLFKLEGLDEQCEDYGQLASYCGGLAGAEDLFGLDDHHVFERGRPERVCGNTAAMLAETRFAAWFEVQGDRSTHYGPFTCSETLAAQQYRAAGAATAAGACC